MREPLQRLRRHTTMSIRRLLLVLSATAIALAAAAAPAAASCAMPTGSLEQRLAEAPIVFVGTVTGLDGTGRIADVTVESVWSGDVAERVQVSGGPDDSQMATSVDRMFTDGERYVFVPVSGDGRVFEDNICSDTQSWTAEIERLRPDEAAAVTGTPQGVDAAADDAADTSGPAAGPQTETTTARFTAVPTIAWVAAAAVAVLGLGAVVLIRRRGGASAS